MALSAEFQDRGLITIIVKGVVRKSERQKIPFANDLLFLDIWGTLKSKKSRNPEWSKQFALVKCVDTKPLTASRTDLQQYRELEALPEAKCKDSLVFTLNLTVRVTGVPINNKLWSFQKLACLTTAVRQAQALLSLPSSPLRDQILYPGLNSVFYHNHYTASLDQIKGLNFEQRSAVVRVKRSIVDYPNDLKVFLLQGPPGTGKSHTIIAMIHHILIMSNYKARICLATPSNAAVDELAKRIIRFNKKCEHNKLDVIKLVRIGNSDSINSEVRPFHLEALVERHGRTDAQKNVPDSVRKELTYVIKRIDSLNKNIQDPKTSKAQCIENRPFFLKPYLVFDIEEGVETQGHSDCHKSYSNPVEASCIAKLCEIVLNVYAATCGGTRESYQSRIGVICPYSDQKHRIIDYLRKSKIQEVVVNTVDSFQGQEKDVIIMSCVRAQSNPTSIGFVENKKRMNVALTRAKFAMYVVGNFKTLICLALDRHF